jgi:hypothetical protein
VGGGVKKSFSGIRALSSRDRFFILQEKVFCCANPTFFIFRLFEMNFKRLKTKKKSASFEVDFFL